MKITSKRNLYLGLIIVFLGIILASIYHMLGGFEEVHVYRLTPVERTVAGKYFEKPGSDSAYAHRELCRNLIADDETSGTLVEVIYLNDTLENIETGRFVGIILENDISEIPSDFAIREYESGIRYAVFLSMHAIVRPRPPKIEGMLYAKAQEDSHELENYFFNLVYEDNSASVEGWVR